MAGVYMWAQPKVGSIYYQEYYEGEAEDMATILAMDQMVDVPAGMYAGCLETGDFTPLEPDVYEHKFYAPGIGTVLEVDEDDVRTELVDIQ